MNYYLVQMILAARNDDAKNWTNVLFIVVVAAVYAVGSIIKARANKIKLEDEEEPEGGRGLKLQPRRQVQPQRRKVVRLQGIAQRLAAKKPDIALEAAELPEVSELTPPTPQLQPDLQGLLESTGKTVRKLKGKSVGIPAVQHQLSLGSRLIGAGYLPEILSDYGDPESIRRAILHYEILGKPLSLRGPADF